MRAVPGHEFARILERHGWRLPRVAGSHHVYGKEGNPARISAPIHGNTPLKIGMQRHFMKLAGLDEDDL